MVLLNKRIIVLAIFLVSLLAVSAVSANENVTDDIVGIENHDNDMISEVDDDFTDASKVLAILIIFILVVEIVLALTLRLLKLPVSVLILPLFVIPGLFTYVVVQQEKRD